MSISPLASATGQTNYPILVNGFLCYSSADVLAARSGRTPEKESAPSADTASRGGQADGTGLAAQSRVGTMTQTADALSATQRSDSTETDKDPTRRGARLDLYA